MKIKKMILLGHVKHFLFALLELWISCIAIDIGERAVGEIGMEIYHVLDLCSKIVGSNQKSHWREMFLNAQTSDQAYSEFERCSLFITV